jgi:hypothetical protein
MSAQGHNPPLLGFNLGLIATQCECEKGAKCGQIGIPVFAG